MSLSAIVLIALKMRDPLPSCPLFIQHLIVPIASRLGLTTLPLHVHEVLFAFALYTFLDVHVSSQISNRLCPVIYRRLPVRTRINWNIHVVSLFQSALICAVALWIILVDRDRQIMDAKGRILGYSGATGMAQALAAGYFLWDAVISVRNFSILGPGSLAHAISALMIIFLGFVSHYGQLSKFQFRQQ